MRIHIDVKEASRRAGVTYRQMDYWVNKRLIPSSGSKGSGRPRFVKADTAVAQAAVLGRVSRAIRRGNQRAAVSIDLLADVVEHWDDEILDLGEGVTLTWTT